MAAMAARRRSGLGIVQQGTRGSIRTSSTHSLSSSRAGSESEDEDKRGGGGGHRLQGNLLRRLKKQANTHADLFQDGVDNETEEAAFLRILDMLEEQDEFASTSEVEEEMIMEMNDDVSEADDMSESEDDEEGLFTGGDFARPLADWELDAAWTDLQSRRLPPIEIAARLLLGVAKHYASLPSLVHIERPPLGTRVIVVGDLHGHFGDFMHIIEEHGEPQHGKGGTLYIFNGDFVDRGVWGPEVLLAIYCLKLRYTKSVFLNRGNHEDQQQNEKPDNGFCHEHCIRAWGREGRDMYSLCLKSFKQLPLAHVLAGEIFIVHGGLPLEPMVTLAEIEAIDRRHSVPVRACNLLGYPRFQKVTAKKDLLTDTGGKVAQGSPGRLVERVGKSTRCLVRFYGPDGGDEAEVLIHGAPELEQDVEIMYDTPAEREKMRSARIFVALLWSDPVNDKAFAGPSRRGAGSYFDERSVKDFLKVNRLRLVLRSHEKRAAGYHEEHRSGKHGLLTATVFSASNYPSGAGEPSGNMASVVLIKVPPDGVPLTSSLTGVQGWREPYRDAEKWTGPCVSNEMRNQLLAASSVAAESLKVSARARVLAKLRDLVYISRPKLLSYWQRVDKEGKGWISRADWARGMRACVIPDDQFPWEWLAPFMLLQDAFHTCNYAGFLARFENALSRRLAERWHTGAIMQMAPGVNTREEAEEAWAQIDRNGDGKLSYAEMKPLLRTKVGSHDVAADEDRVYTVMMSLDKDKSGFVEKAEFVNAIVSRFSSVKPFGKDVSAFDRQVSQTSSRAIVLETALARAEGDELILQCWAATQAALRALSSSRGCATSVFQVLDGDHDGRIDRREFRMGLCQLLRGSALLKVADQWEPLLWQLVDEDGSGFVSPEELRWVFSVHEIVAL